MSSNESVSSPVLAEEADAVSTLASPSSSSSTSTSLPSSSSSFSSSSSSSSSSTSSTSSSTTTTTIPPPTSSSTTTTSTSSSTSSTSDSTSDSTQVSTESGSPSASLVPGTELSESLIVGVHNSTRPPFSYASLVAQALHAKDRATLQEIYAWVAENYPHHYKMDDLWWQPSIRYNLSLHKCFCKIPKTEPGQKGALWYYVDLPTYFYDKGTLSKRKLIDDPARLSEEFSKQSQARQDSELIEGEGEAGEDAVKEEKDGKKGRRGPKKKRKAPATEEGGDEETTPTKARRLSREEGEEGGEDESPLKDAPAETLSTVEKMDLDGQEARQGEAEEAEELDIGSQLVKELARKDHVGAEADGAKAGAADADSRQPADQPQDPSSVGGESKPPNGSAQTPGKFSIAKALAHAIETSAEKKMTLSSLYSWFADTYPTYVTTNENTWKGAIRYNLSIHPHFVKLPRTDTDGGKGSFWSLGEVGANTPSPSRARRPKYMKEFGKNKEDGEQSSAMDTSLDTSVSGEASLTTQQLLQSMATAEAVEGEHSNTATSSSTLENPPATLENPEGVTDGAALPKQEKREARPRKKKGGKGSVPLLGPDGYPTLVSLVDSVKGRVEEDSDILAADPEEESQGDHQQGGGGGQTPVKQLSVPSLSHFAPGMEIKAYLTSPKEKPPFSYMHLIGQAILAHESERATLSEIINYIMKTYPYFREKTDPWDNSVRSLLASKACFVKTGKSDGGPAAKGNYWTIDPTWSHVLNKETVFKGGKVFLRAKKADPADEEPKPASDFSLSQDISELFEPKPNPSDDHEGAGPSTSAAPTTSDPSTVSQLPESGSLALLSETLEEAKKGVVKSPKKGPKADAEEDDGMIVEVMESSGHKEAVSEEIGEDKDFDQLGDFGAS